MEKIKKKGAISVPAIMERDLNLVIIIRTRRLKTHSDGSFYYKNPDGSTFYDNGKGSRHFTPGGSKEK
ncbi:hypothetical protein HDU76_004718 [Blyttiomyces sp. JEL0837]|nr:hypothetical protein HDU76_004718 [Blyttiomyces sp. JEL0837]